MSNASENSRRREATHNPIPALEWIVSGLGLMLVTASLVFLLHKAIFEEVTPPDMQAQLLSSRAANQGYIATVELKNTGGQTAADVLIVAHLTHQQGEGERQARVDFLPPQSVRQVELYFHQLPTADNLYVQFISYHIP